MNPITKFYFCISFTAGTGVMGVVYGTFIKDTYNFKSSITDIWTIYIACITAGLLALSCFLVLCTCCMQNIHRSSRVQYIDDAEIHSNAGTVMSAPELENQHAYNPQQPMPQTPSYPQLQQQTSLSYPQHGHHPHQPYQHQQQMYQYPMQPIHPNASYPQY